MAKAKVERIRKEIEVMKATKCEKSKPQRDASRSSNSGSLAEPLDKLVVKRMKKAEEQRKNPGQQEMPDYASPNIQQLGKGGK